MTDDKKAKIGDILDRAVKLALHTECVAEKNDWPLAWIGVEPTKVYLKGPDAFAYGLVRMLDLTADNVGMVVISDGETQRTGVEFTWEHITTNDNEYSLTVTLVQV